MELNNPKLAYRSCSHCRQFVYDEDTGDVRTNIRTKEMLPRANEKTLPCVFDKCDKGHYSKPLQLEWRDRQLIDLFRASRASGGSVLNDAERNDSLVLLMFSQLEQIFSDNEKAVTAQMLAAVAMRGEKHG